MNSWRSDLCLCGSSETTNVWPLTWKKSKFLMCWFMFRNKNCNPFQILSDRVRWSRQIQKSIKSITQKASYSKFDVAKILWRVLRTIESKPPSNNQSPADCMPAFSGGSCDLQAAFWRPVAASDALLVAVSGGILATFGRPSGDQWLPRRALGGCI